MSTIVTLLECGIQFAMILLLVAAIDRAFHPQPRQSAGSSDRKEAQ